MSHAHVVLAGARLVGAPTPVDVRVRNGRVAEIAPSLRPDDGEVVTLAGRVVLPGLWDHHVHATQWASTRARLDVRGAASAAEAAALVRTHVSSPTFSGDVLVGHGMRHLAWPDSPDVAMLDDAAPGIAVVLQGVDLHTAWASTPARERTGLADLPDALLHEGACFHAVATLVDAAPDQQDAWVLDAMHAAAARGVTGIRDFEFGDPLVVWRRRMADHEVPVRVVANVYPDALDAARGRGWPTGHVVEGTDGRLAVGHLKLFVDGALNSRTALCHDPYPGGDDHGAAELDPEQLVAAIAAGRAAGLDPAVHAIGDRAVTVALDALDVAGGAGRVEHAQLVAHDDVPRLARPGRVAGVQPAHLLDDRDVAEAHWPGRTDRAFPLAAMLAAGVRLELGSDAPVSALDPWRGIVAATARTADDRPAWHPGQAIGVADALRATCDGRLHPRPGDPADLVVLDDDPTTCPVEVLRQPGVAGTMVGGRWAHRDGLAAP